MVRYTHERLQYRKLRYAEVMNIGSIISCSSMHTGIYLLAGTVLGMLFVIIGLKLALGTAGIIPSLNIPGGLISFAAIE